MTGADLNTGNGTTYSYAASYDDDLRLLSSGVSVAGPGGATLYDVQVGYDANSNVTGVDTTLGTGTGTTTSTDNQSFCYDDLDRLTWASSATASGPDAPGTTTPCASNTAGTLNGQNALYTASYAYDNLDRLTTGPADGGSSYTYGDPAHLHAATSTSGGYSATYDAAGNMTCRAPTGAATCTGSSPTGQGLTYDHEGQLIGWTSALHGQSSPTPNTAAFAYDGEGSRVAMQSTNGALGTTTTTDYLLGGLEEQQAVGVGGSHPSSSLTEYYPLPGIGTAVRVTANGTGTSTLSYLASDGLGSVTVALSTTGTVTAQALYSPYGSVRYASGQMPTAHGYTGQLADAMTGLSYYGARSYDPALGQFTSADTVLDGLNRYAYVHGDPESDRDPTGHVDLPLSWWVTLICAVLATCEGSTYIDAPQTLSDNPAFVQSGSGQDEIVTQTLGLNANDFGNFLVPHTGTGVPPPEGTPGNRTGGGSGLNNVDCKKFPNDPNCKGWRGGRNYGPQGSNGISGSQRAAKNPGIIPGKKGSGGYRGKLVGVQVGSMIEVVMRVEAGLKGDQPIFLGDTVAGSAITAISQYYQSQSQSQSQSQGVPGSCVSMIDCAPPSTVPIPGYNPVNPGVPGPDPWYDPEPLPIFGDIRWLKGDYWNMS